MNQGNSCRWKVSKLRVRYKKVILSEVVASNSFDLHRVFLGLWDLETIDLREDFCVLTMDSRLQQIGFYRAFRGGSSSSYVDRKLVYSIALGSGCDSVAVAHNHPSGDVTPSAEDFRITTGLKQGFDVLGVRFADHLIMSRDRYFSFADEGYV